MAIRLVVLAKNSGIVLSLKDVYVFSVIENNSFDMCFNYIKDYFRGGYKIKVSYNSKVISESSIKYILENILKTLDAMLALENKLPTIKPFDKIRVIENFKHTKLTDNTQRKIDDNTSKQYAETAL